MSFVGIDVDDEEGGAFVASILGNLVTSFRKLPRFCADCNGYGCIEMPETIRPGKNRALLIILHCIGC